MANHDGEFALDPDTQGDYTVICMEHIDDMMDKVKEAQKALEKAYDGVYLAMAFMRMMNASGTLKRDFVETIEGWKKEEC
jgi:hypothetical protein